MQDVYSGVREEEMADEYPPEGRFAWDLVMDAMTLPEVNALCDRVDEGDLNGAEAVLSGVEDRVFGEA